MILPHHQSLLTHQFINKYMPDQVSPDYLTDYNAFLLEHKQGSTDAETVGWLIAKMAQYYANYNMEFAKADFIFSQTASVFENQQDQTTLKPLSSAKAKVLSEATPAHESKLNYEAHVKNIDTILQALKALQKSLLKEYSHSSV